MTTDSVSGQPTFDSIPKKNTKAIDSKVDYVSGDSIVFDVSSKVVKTYGKGTVLYENIDLQSEYIELDIARNEIFAKGIYDSLVQKNIGSPVYKDGGDAFDSDSMRYNFRSKQGLAFGIYAKQDDGYLHGGRTKIHANKEIHIHHGKYTTCDEKCPHFYIEISKGKVIPNDKILFGPAWLVVDEIPIPIVIPFGYFPLKKGRSNGIIIPTVGEESGKGFYFRNMGVYFGMGEYADFKLTADIYTLLSWRTNVRTNYISRYKFNGNFEFAYSSLVLDEIRQAPTFNVRWNHTQNPKTMHNANFGANVNYGSVGYARQNSNVQSDYLNSSVSSSVSYSKRFQGTPLSYSVNLGHSQNNIDSTITLTLPQLRFTASSFAPLKRKKIIGAERFYEKITLGYSADMQHRLTNAKMDSTFYSPKTIDAFQSGINHTIPISTSFRVLNFFTVSPSFNYQERWYNKKHIKRWDDDVVFYTHKDTIIGGVVVDTIREMNRVYNYSFGLGVNTKLYGMYHFRSSYLRAIRHVITPTLSYSISPDFSDEKYNFYSMYQKNAEGEMAKYSYYEKGIFGIPGSQKQSALRLSIGNNIEAKIRDKQDSITGYKKVKIIENFSIDGSYNFAADSLRMSLISIGGYTTLMKRLTIRYSATLDPYAIAAREQNGGKVPVRTNLYMLDKYNTLWRKTDEQWQTSVSYTFGPIKNSEEPSSTSEYFSYWDVPWSASVNYSLRVPRKYYYNYNNELDSVSSNMIQTIGVNGKVSLSKKWNIQVYTGWDFESKGISHTKIDVYRDLHCWQMSFNWIPIGPRQYWEFSLRVKADMLKDLKYEMRSPTSYF